MHIPFRQALKLERTVPALLAALLVFVPVSARANRDRGIPVQTFKPAGNSFGFFNVESPVALDKATVDFVFGFSYVGTPLVLDFSGTNIKDNKNVLNYVTTIDFGISLGIMKNLELSVYMPLHRVGPHEAYDLDNDWGFTANDPLNTMKSSIPKSVPGDMEFALKYNFLRTAGFSAAVRFGVILPFGVEEVFAGEHDIALKPAVLFGWQRGKLALFGNISYLIRENFQVLDPADHTQVLLSAGEEIHLTAGARYDAFKSVSFLLAGTKYLPVELLPQDVSNKDDRDAPMELMAGVQWRPHQTVSINFLGGTDAGLSQEYGRKVPFRAGAHLVWHGALIQKVTTVGDRDGDGIPDDIDACPDAKEDKDGFEDEDGCPDPDNDQDGIPDKLDKCPLEPEDEDGFEDSDGCPDPDNDGDGILDSADACPGKDADKKNNFKDTKEDKDGFQDDDGCPDPDNDGDGIPDKEDKCPNQKETFNGIDDTDGCPDSSMGPAIRGGQIHLKGRIEFEKGKAIISRKSLPLLLGISNLLKANTAVRLVRIEAHTDRQGSEAKNRYLSTARAAAVRTYLISKGAAPFRLQAVGYGSKFPIMPNNTAKNRAANRRIEFIIVYQ
ncbi:OmpA family protein [Myxococcota bacterium]|nr:OmpA family protein [Myxococcota bacterium]MBU1535017.1 OmpA family protein [Myxococcota bacterium]